jgi:hypothetical protein
MKTLAVLLILIATPVSAANVYVRVGAAGAATGADWTDAYTALPSVLVRGNTYYIADGTYGAYTFDDAVSGTSVITIRKATVASHGTETGWDNTYGDGVTTFAGASTAVFGITVLTKYIDAISPAVGDLVIAGGLDLSDGSGDNPADIAFLNFYNITAKWVHVVAQDVLFSGGDFGNYNPCLLEGPEDAFRLWDNGVVPSTYPTSAASRITIDGVKIHDVTDQGDSCAGTAVAGIHVDCMQWLGGHDYTVKNSIFYNCPTSGILGESYRDTLDGFVIENNFFQAVMHPGTTIQFGALINGTNYIRHNTIKGGVGTNATGGTINLTGNIITVSSCQRGVFDYNLFVGGTTCGTNIKTGTPALVSEPTASYQNGLVPDYRLTSSDTAARDRGNVSSFAVTDIDGTARYLGVAPDLGADEYEGVDAPTGSGSGSPRGRFRR